MASIAVTSSGSVLEAGQAEAVTTTTEPERRGKCPWCQQPKVLVVKRRFVYLPAHKLVIGGADCLGSNMPMREVVEGEEPTDHWQ